MEAALLLLKKFTDLIHRFNLIQIVSVTLFIGLI